MQPRSLEWLVALEEIRELARSYAFAVDSYDWDLMGSLWVETDTPEQPPYLDIHAMRGVAGRLTGEGGMAGGVSTLLIGNHRITFESKTRASGSVYCHCFFEREAFYEQTLVYMDDYERHDGRWLFRRRKHLLWWGVERPHPMAQPDADWPKAHKGAGVASELIRKRPAL